MSRELVHRAAVAEVFVTDAVRAGSGEEERFLVAAQWPRDHALYHPDRAGRTDPLLFAETIRQAMVYVAHSFLDVPLGRRFIGSGLSFRITEPDALGDSGAPLSVVLDVRRRPVERPLPGRTPLALDVDLLVDGRPCGFGSIDATAVDERRYTLLRGRGAAAAADAAHAAPALLRPVPARRVGRLRDKDSVLGRPVGAPESDAWHLRVDLGHAVLFDHPTDHLPLMVLLEGFRQLGFLRAHRGRGAALPLMLTEARVDCQGWGELDQPVRLLVADETTGRSGVHRLRVVAEQQGRVLAVAETAWSAAAGSAALNRLAG
ncbi:ScbA/BarX family gamma-butyrolactone biosynthesis protein [Streptacidiphilus monticola]